MSPSWRQIQRQTGLRNLSRILSTAVNVFLYFTLLHKFKSNSKHSSVFFTCVQELFPYEVVANTFVNPYFWILSENLPFFKKMTSKSSFLASKFKTESLFLSFINVERVLLIRLCKCSMFITTFSSKLGSRFFFPLGNLSLSNHNHDSDQLPSVTPTQAISPIRELWGKRLV